MQVLWFILLLIDPSSGQRSADSLQLLTDLSRQRSDVAWPSNVSTWSC